MFTIRVSPSQLIDRLNAESNSPEFVANASVLSSCELNLVTLKETVTGPINNSIRNVTSELNARGATIPMFRPADIDGWWLNVDTAPKLTKEFEEQHRKARVKPGDIVLSIAGTIGTAARVPSSIKYGNINGSSARIPPKESIAGYLLAYLNSNVGNRALLRLAVGSVQKHLNLEDLPNVPVPLPNNYVQNYIGKKVRQAERLREWTNSINNRLHQTFKKPLDLNNRVWKKQSRVSSKLLTEMLTAETYKEEYTENQRRLKTEFYYLKKLTDFFESISNGYDDRREVENGIKYIKVADIRPNCINIDDAGSIPKSALKNASLKQIPQKGDLLLTRKGSFGISAVVQNDQEFLVSSEVFVCKPYKKNNMTILSYFLNSYFAQCQFWQFSTGTTMPGISQENLGKIVVPDFDEKLIQVFWAEGNVVSNAIYSAQKIILAAKLLVEALIEGHLTESELEVAQQALENGDNSLDKAILSRLTAKGIDIEGEPLLFPDLDALYQLLAEAQAATDKDTVAENTDEQAYATS